MKTKETKKNSSPLGATVEESGVNFALFSSNASGCELLLFNDALDKVPFKTLKMTREGDVWQVFVEGLEEGALYLYSVDGPFDPGAGHRFDKTTYLLDPYARQVKGADGWIAPSTSESVVFPKCVVTGPDNFDWQDDRRPDTPLVESIIYEVHLRGFTAHKNSPITQKKGTYLGFVQMIPYLRKLGITAVELMPIMEWYRPTHFVNPRTGTANMNDWGYDTLAFMAPDERLATVNGRQISEFKTLVRELHKAGIEVILDIVLNHSAESNQSGPTISFRGVDNKVYYLLSPGNPAEYVNFTGCGNTVNCNHPIVSSLIIDVLKTWVEEFHVDGFRFDLGAVFGIDTDLSVKPDTRLLKAMVSDPVVSKVKLIAEPWSIGAYLMGQFPVPFSEWSDRFRDTVRSFVRAEPGLVLDLQKVISGSTDMFGESGLRLPVNFFTAHDGFSAMDLVSFEQKRNEDNGEENRDGSDHNRSWNCGYEGDLADAPLSDEDKASILHLRKQQIKNFFTLMLLSRGVPMILFGDEMGRTNGGNNNTWNQPELNELDWELLESNSDLHRFVQEMIAFRKKHALGGYGQNPRFREVVLHGTLPNQPDYSDSARFAAFELASFAEIESQAVYCAANAYWEPLKVQLPEGNWYRIVDTGSREEGGDIHSQESANLISGEFEIGPRSTMVFLKQSEQE